MSSNVKTLNFPTLKSSKNRKKSNFRLGHPVNQIKKSQIDTKKNRVLHIWTVVDKLNSSFNYNEPCDGYFWPKKHNLKIKLTNFV